MKIFKVNKSLLAVKVHYFLFNGAFSCVTPILVVHAKQLGISAIALGIIYTVLPFLILVIKPLIGAIADYTQKLKLILMTLLCIVIPSLLGMNFIPLPENSEVITKFTNSSKELFCWQNSSYLISYEVESCIMDSFNGSGKCSASCSLCKAKSVVCGNMTNYTRDGSIPEIEQPPFEVIFNSTEELLARCYYDSNSDCDEACYVGQKKCEASSYDFHNPPLQLWLFSVLVSVGSMAIAASATLSNSACYNALESQPHLFGRQRMWGTIGWGSFAALTGYLNQIATDYSTSSIYYNYAPGFYLFTVLSVLDLVAVKNLKMTSVKAPENLCKDVSLLLMQPKIIAFLFGVYFNGIFTGLYRSYLFWYLRTLKASQLLLGLISGVQCFLGELPFFFFSGWLIGRMGQINIMTISFIALGLRFVACSYLTNPWWVLPVEILQGPAFGSFYAAMTSYAEVVAPEGTEATMQGLVGGTFDGLANSRLSIRICYW